MSLQITGRMVKINDVTASVADASAMITEECQSMTIKPSSNFTIGEMSGSSAPSHTINILGSSHEYSTNTSSANNGAGPNAYLKLKESASQGQRYVDIYGQDIQLATESQMLVIGDDVDGQSGITGFVSYDSDWYISDADKSSGLSSVTDFKIKLGKDGQIHAKGALDVDAAADISGAVGLAATDVATSVRGSLSVAQDADLNGALDVAGAVSLASTSAATSVRGSLGVAGNADIDGGLDVAGAADILGAVGLAATDVATSVRGSLSVAQDADLDGALDVAGAVSLASTTAATSVRGSLDVAGNADIDGGLDAAGAVGLGASSAATSVRGALNVAGAIDADGVADIADTLTLSKQSGTGLSVASNASITGNLVMAGQIHGPASMIIDPATVGDNTGTLVVLGNLDVRGTQTTVDSTTVSIQDLNMQLGDNATTQNALDGAGIQTGGTMSTGEVAPTFVYAAAADSWESNKALRSQQGLAFGGTGYDKFTVSDAGVVTVAGTLDVDMNVTLGAELEVTSDATLSAELIMSQGQNIYLNGSSGAAKLVADAQNAVSILGSSLMMNGSVFKPNSNDTADLGIGGNSPKRFKDLYLSGDSDILGSLELGAAANIGTTLGVGGATTLSSTLSVADTSVFSKSITIGNESDASSVQKVANAANVDFGASSNRFNDFYFINGDLSTNLTVGADLSVGADISVTANATFSGASASWGSGWDFDVAGFAQFQKKVQHGAEVYGPSDAWELTTLGKFAGKHAAFSLADSSSVDFQHDNGANTMAHRISPTELAIGLTDLDSTEAKKFSVAVSSGNVVGKGTITIHGDAQFGENGASKATIDAATGNMATQGTLDVTGAATLSSRLDVTGGATFSSTVALEDDTTLTSGKEFILDPVSGNTQVGFKKLALAADYVDPQAGAQPANGADDVLITEGYLFEALAGNDALFQLADYTATNQAAHRVLRINGDNDGFDPSDAVEMPDSGVRLLEGKLISHIHPIAAGEAIGQYQMAYVDMDSTDSSVSLKKAYGKAITSSFSSQDLQWLRGACLINVAVADEGEAEVVQPGQIIKEQAVAGFVMPAGIDSSMDSASSLAEAKGYAAYDLMGRPVIMPASANAGKLQIEARTGDYVHMQLGQVVDFTVAEKTGGGYEITHVTWMYGPQKPELKFQ